MLLFPLSALTGLRPGAGKHRQAGGLGGIQALVETIEGQFPAAPNAPLLTVQVSLSILLLIGSDTSAEADLGRSQLGFQSYFFWSVIH